MNLKPLGDRIVVKVLAQEKTASGIVLPDKAKENPRKVKSWLWARKMLENGTRSEMEVKVGDKVIFLPLCRHEVKIRRRILTA